MRICALPALLLSSTSFSAIAQIFAAKRVLSALGLHFRVPAVSSSSSFSSRICKLIRRRRFRCRLARYSGPAVSERPSGASRAPGKAIAMMGTPLLRRIGGYAGAANRLRGYCQIAVVGAAQLGRVAYAIPHPPRVTTSDIRLTVRRFRFGPQGDIPNATTQRALKRPIPSAAPSLPSGRGCRSLQ